MSIQATINTKTNYIIELTLDDNAINKLAQYGITIDQKNDDQIQDILSSGGFSFFREGEQPIYYSDERLPENGKMIIGKIEIIDTEMEEINFVDVEF